MRRRTSSLADERLDGLHELLLIELVRELASPQRPLQQNEPQLAVGHLSTNK